MGGRASDSERGALETLALAGVGAVALLADRADELAETIAARLGADRDEVRAAISDAVGSWRRELERTGERTVETASRVAEELGVASRQTVEELELRVAQLEHRLRLLERGR
jgi:polyhydroxyalkanoate synthesis regulator phasin